jgi:glutamate/tyrosine decarboxylase-like PLP-dependent enzyme
MTTRDSKSAEHPAGSHTARSHTADTSALLTRTAEIASDFLAGASERPVRPSANLEELRTGLARPLPEHGNDPLQVIEELARDADPGIISSAGPRFFGFVIGGSLPVAVAADWLTSAWDQNAGIYVAGPAESVVEETAAGWLLELFGLPADASVGFTTGCQMANFTALAAARRAVLLSVGWDVERNGLQEAPEVTVVAGAEAHVTIDIAIQLLGLGTARIRRVPADDQGRMVTAGLRMVLGEIGDGPLIVCAQAGNVNTGAFDPLEEIADVVRERQAAWLHVDGAFGLWATVSRELRGLTAGVDRADSWATDCHKWLNVPYDSGLVIVRDPAVHRAAMMLRAAYLIQAARDERDPSEYVPEFSRRARGFPVYAALRALGRDGVRDLVERCCRIARGMAERLRAEPGVRVLNVVVLNQVLVRFDEDDEVTRRTIRAVQVDGTCWLSGTTWHGMAAMRISVSNWSTTEADGERSVDAILRCFASVR